LLDSTKSFVLNCPRMTRVRGQPIRPTHGELEILEVLWQTGPATVREVYEHLSERKPIVYTTVLKLMQIMTDKGLVQRDESQRAHVYKVRVAREEVQKRLVGDLLDRLFQGSAKQLVMQAVTAGKTSREELAEIRRLLDQLARGAK
jgi:BlaI family transcriptional regulator, penicillinase repressor